MKRKKRFLLVIFCFLLILGWLTFFGEKGLFHLFRLKKELVRIQEENRKIEGENERLREEVKRLKSDPRAIEEIARRELGMVKEGEILYRFEVSPPVKERSP